MNTLLAILIAAVPYKWTVETSRVQPAVIDVVHGESIALEAALQSAGKPLDLTGSEAHIYWQTNGMAEAWWVGSATVTSNRLSATFLPEMDPGAASVTGFIGIPGEIYRAAFQLRFRHGPGAIPNEIEPPVRTLDFDRVTVENAPWATPGDVTDEATARANADAALSSRISELTGGAVTEDDVERIASNIADEKVAGKRGYTDMTILKNDATHGPQRGGVEYWKLKVGGFPAYYIPWDESTKSFHQTLLIDQNDHELEITSMALMSTSMDGSDPVVVRFSLTLDGTSVTNWSNQAEINIDGIGRLWATTLDNMAKESYVDEKVANYVPTTRKVNGQPLTSDINIEGMSANAIELKSGALKTHDNATTITASTVGAYTTSQVDNALSGKASSATVDAIGQQVGVIAAHLNAEDAKVVITNYDSVVHMPEASFQVKVEGEWLKVWDEMTRWNWFLGNFETFSNAVNQALSTKGEKEWGWFNSATGDASPDGLLQLAQPRIQICSGAAYQRYGDAAGAYWVLESNGLVANINGTTNGFFRVLDEEGNAQFEIVKGDKQTVFATAKTMRSEVMGVAHYFTEYAVTNAVSNPVAEFTTSLADINWIPETSSSCPFNVSWTNKGNNIYEIEWWPKGTQPQAFMKCGYERGGETYIKNTIPVSMDYLILNGVKYRLGTATISGHTVLTLTQE